MHCNTHMALPESGNFSHRLGIPVFQIEQHHLPVNRLETMNELKQSFDRQSLFDVPLMIFWIWYQLDFFECGESSRVPSTLPDYIVGNGIVSHAKEPRSDRTAVFEILKAPP